MKATIVADVTVMRVCAMLRDCVDQLIMLLHITQRHVSTSPADINPRAVDGVTKVHCELSFAVQRITELLTELKEKRTFHRLLHSVEEEKRTNAKLHNLIIGEKRDRLKIKMLKKHLADICKETELQTQERDRTAAHLEDQLKELNMKKRLREKYMNDSTQLKVYQGQKLNCHKEKQIEAEIEMLKKQLMDEEQAHQELLAVLKKNQNNLEEKVDYWMERYDNDTDDIQHQINTINTKRSNDQEQKQELTKKCQDTEQLIMEDKLEKEKLEKERLRGKAATKIQTWWREIMVKKCLGPYKKVTKPKQKKKKGNKGKKK